MIKFIIGILKNKLGFDKSIFLTSLARVFQAVSGVVNILFIARFLSEVEQGFYYTFASILAIQIFFELGLNSIITQYVAHEASHLSISDSGEFVGPAKHRSRLSSLLHLSIKWYSIIAGFLFVVLLFAGMAFFREFNSSNDVSWIIPWSILSLTTTLSFIINPFLAFLEGLGKVKEIAKIRLQQQLFSTFLLWICFALGTKLYAAGISNLIGLLFIIILIRKKKFTILFAKIWSYLDSDRINYKTEVFPYQWKIALSWISGYFIFQLFNPVLFAKEGPVIAGQMGMTLSVLNGILALSISWISTKVPSFSGLIAQKKFSLLDNLFSRTLKQSAFVNFILLIFMGVLIYIIRIFNIEVKGKLLGDRFLDYFPMICMMIPIFLNHIVASWATYLRCHKEEPYLVNSIIAAVLCISSTLVFGYLYGVYGITIGYCAISILMFPWSNYIFITKKSEWHAR